MNHAELAQLLSQPKYVGTSAEILLRGISNELCLTPGEPPQAVPDFYVPARQAATFPWTSHALWFYSQMARWQQVKYTAEHLPAVRATYRPDLYRLALAPLGVNVPMQDGKVEGIRPRAHALASTVGTLQYGPDGFFDGKNFDPDDLNNYLVELNNGLHRSAPPH